jgi:hypothetical protein
LNGLEIFITTCCSHVWSAVEVSVRTKKLIHSPSKSVKQQGAKLLDDIKK